jgi:hypothetical protein
MNRAFSTHGSEDECYRLLGGKPEVRRALGRPKYRWHTDVKVLCGSER